MHARTRAVRAPVLSSLQSNSCLAMSRDSLTATTLVRLQQQCKDDEPHYSRLVLRRRAIGAGWNVSVRLTLVKLPPAADDGGSRCCCTSHPTSHAEKERGAKVVGIGVELEEAVEHGQVVTRVKALKEGYPAHLSGMLRVGDTILAVDSTPLTSRKAREVPHDAPGAGARQARGSDCRSNQMEQRFLQGPSTDRRERVRD